MKTKAEVVFGDELSFIESKEIHQFVLDVFNLFTPEYFWTVAAATTGKYHPKISLGSGGLVRHIKYAVWWGLEIMQCWPNLAITAIDEVTAALLLHDLNKNGDKLDAKGFPTLKKSTGVHGPYLGNKIRTWIAGTITDMIKIDKHGSVYECPDRIDRIDRIIAAIEGHMGIWTDPSYEMLKPQYIDRTADHSGAINLYDVCHIVHLADYCSARKADDEMNLLDKDPSHHFSVMFAIGQEDNDCGTGFWAGPVPDLNMMIAEKGRDEKTVIVAIDPLNGDEAIYRWNPDGKEWIGENDLHDPGDGIP